MAIQDAVPVVFRAPRALRALNLAAVATSLAACTSAALMGFLGQAEWAWAVTAGAPTLVVGALWAAALRWRKTVPGLPVRWGWLSSLPLAMLNGALAAGLTFTMTAGVRESFLGAALLGATLGVIVWGPALVAVLLAFGVPIAAAQRLAKLGLSGEERGEMIVGGISAGMGLLAAFVAWMAHASSAAVIDPHDDMPVGHALFFVYVVTAIATGAAATLYGASREARRRRFVARVEASEEPGYRVDQTAAGKVLLRVAPATSYRVADRAEELFELDASGDATHRALTAPRS